MKTNQVMKVTALVAALAVVVLVGAGCPRMAEETKVITLFTTDASQLKADVAEDDIESFVLTVSEITLVPYGGEDDEEEIEEPEAKQAEEDSHVVVFEGSMDIDLKDLSGVSEVLSTAEVPAGVYSQIRLSISDPRLVLASDPETVITDVHLTANNRVFITQQFEIPEGQTSLLMLDFGGLHLVQTGNNGYVLTPQIQAILDIVNADVYADGEVSALDADADTFTLLMAEGELEIDYAAAVIWLPTDVDAATGTEADLADGLLVEVSGLLGTDGVVDATAVYILPEEIVEPPVEE